MQLVEAASKKRQLGSTMLTPYAKRMPAPLPTGDELADDRNRAHHTAMQHAISNVQCDWEIEHLITATMSNYLAQKAEQEWRDGEDVFEKCTSLHNCSGDAFLIGFIVGNSDMTEQDVFKCKSKRPDFVQTMIMLATQHGDRLQYESRMKIKPIYFAWLESRVALFNGFLTNLKLDKAFDDTGVFNLRDFGCYFLKFHATTGKLIEATHRGTAHKVKVDDGFLDKTWRLEDNILDMSAKLVKAKMPDYPVCKLFEDAQTGPFSYEQFSGKAATKRLKENQKKVADIYEARKAAIRPEVESATISKQLEDDHKTKSKAKMGVARAKAKALANERAQANTFKFD